MAIGIAGSPTVGGRQPGHRRRRVAGPQLARGLLAQRPGGIGGDPAGCLAAARELRPPARLDVTGLVPAGAGLLGLTWGLVQANTVGWSSGGVIGALAARAALAG